MSIKVQTLVWDCKGLDGKGELLVMLALADWANDEGEAYPSLSQLSKKCRLSRRGLVDVLSRLKGEYVEWDENSGGRNIRNQYRILIEALKNPVNSEVTSPFSEKVNSEAASPFKDTNSEVTSPFSDRENSEVASPFEDPETVKLAHENSEVASLAINHHINHQYNSTTKNYNKPHSLSSTPRESENDECAEDLSFLPERDQVYRDSILDELRQIPPDCIDQAYIRILRGQHRGAAPLSSLLALRKRFSHTMLVAAMVYAKSESDGGASLKFLEGIMTRWSAGAAPAKLSEKDERVLRMNFLYLDDFPTHLREEAARRRPELTYRNAAA